MPRVGFVAASFLAAVSFLQAESNFGRQWMDHYYQNPQPDKVVTAMYSLSRTDYFDSAAHVDAAVGFFSTVFQKNPDSVDTWLREGAGVLPERGRRIFAAAAWLAGHSAANQELTALAGRGNDESRVAAAQMLRRDRSQDLGDIPVASESAMSLQWGAFLASGESRYINNVFAAFGSDQPALATGARYALVQEASENPRLLEVCRANLNRQSPAVRAAFEAALNDLPSRSPGA